MFPVGVMARDDRRAGRSSFPRDRELTAIFARRSSQLPISLVNFGLVRVRDRADRPGVRRAARRVRTQQTGSDPFTSLVGLVLVEAPQVRRLHRPPRRRGHVLRLRRQGVRRDGRSHDRAAGDPTAQRHGEPAARTRRSRSATTRSSTSELIHTTDDHKDAVTAQVSVCHEGDEASASSTRRSGTTTRATDSRPPRSRSTCASTEDVYVVLTGFDLETQAGELPRLHQPAHQLGVGRASWCFALGTFICLIPQAVVDRVSARPRTRLGARRRRGAARRDWLRDVGRRCARRRRRPAAGGGARRAGAVGRRRSARARGAAATRARATTTTPAGRIATGPIAARRRAPDEGPGLPVRRLPARDLHDCKCGYAAEERAKVLSMLAGRDLSGDARRAGTARRRGVATFIEALRRRAGARAAAQPALAWICPVRRDRRWPGLLCARGRARRWCGGARRRGRRRAARRRPGPRTSSADEE